MAEKTIMLCCAAGMSTSLLVSKMQKAAESDGIDAEIFAAAAADADAKLEEKHPDVLMLGPQVRYLEGQFKAKLSIPVEVINMQDYGMMNGEKVLREAVKLIG
ncbi:PTS sugar transporter subunit IIB [Companilactobacillus crustorum]|uniref:Cellobiose-specific PTS system IIB component n=3 Tax=Companilactobacillus TaxID=2767879 RepID=A0A837RJM0_9LACO|nr:PTS sugar transporter subunit IIB [Companilactobacillus crustorum]HCD08694.1 PTS sugar transporter subunit IIB [Lactobacillus sp.]APU71537.1 Cellobiose-specific phosphotransferase enzyme IIB component [Companilactobacillus crustorum]KRK43139.1 cellobiose-specific PTS system IIB component [Companilactobacillus crustorum JCM 15951]KRO20784.1 cellobiose-specific PTS system IIB component [Companilactobacillus crustorum]WDT66439.1 PTS sugar transporter subunit IIB [Companilactobacillus crustorum